MSKVRFAAVLVLGVVLVAGIALLAALYSNPVGLSVWASRQALGSAGLEKRKVATAVGRLTFWEGGRGTPVVLLHGAGDQAGSWQKVVAPLAERHRLLVLDLPGHGDSAPDRGPLPLALGVAAVEAVLAARAEGERATLIGNSMGGWMALLYALEHPERLRSIVLENGGGLSGELPSGFTLLPKNRDETRRMLAALTGPESKQPPDFVLDDLAQKLRKGPLPRTMEGFQPSDLLDGRLGGLDLPVALVWGDADQLFPLAYAERLHGEIPGATLAAIPGCGHVPHVECPERFLAAVTPLLADN